MECLLCHRQYINLGVHLRHKHHIDPMDYRAEFGILRVTALVDQELSEHLSKHMLNRLKDPELLTSVREMCLTNAKNNIGHRHDMSDEGKRQLAQRDKRRNDVYLRNKSSLVASILHEKITALDVKKQIGMGANAVRSMSARGLVKYSQSDAKTERDKRAALTIRTKAESRVKEAMLNYDFAVSGADFCRLSGISIKTYKNWLKANLIVRNSKWRRSTKVTPASPPDQSPSCENKSVAT